MPPPPIGVEKSRLGFAVSSDKRLLDVDAVYAFLSTCYWSLGIHRSRVECAIEHSICFGVYDTTLPAPGPAPGTEPTGRHLQVGFARVITDYASFAYLADVFIIESYRGRGLSKWMMETIVAHPDLKGLRRFCLLTRDAHGLYKQFGFAPIPDPSRYLELIDREGYRQAVQR